MRTAEDAEDTGALKQEYARIADIANPARVALVRRGRRLEYLTIAWNSAEAAVALIAGLLAGSIALIGFGLDSVIEVSSGATVLWRLLADHERAERLALRGRASLRWRLTSPSTRSRPCGCGRPPSARCPGSCWPRCR